MLQSALRATVAATGNSKPRVRQEAESTLLFLWLKPARAGAARRPVSTDVLLDELTRPPTAGRAAVSDAAAQSRRAS